MNKHSGILKNKNEMQKKSHKAMMKAERFMLKK